MELKGFLLFFTLITFVCGQEIGRRGRTAEPFETGYSFCTATNVGANFCSTKCTRGAVAFQCGTNIGQGVLPSTNVNCTADSATPYCLVATDGSAASCSATPDTNCLKCPRAGVFPDYQSCSNFYICTADETTGVLTATSYSCPGTQRFNPSSQSYCKAGGCVQPRCTRSIAEWRPYNYAGYTYNHYGLYCENGSALFIDSCPSGLSLEYTQTGVKNCYLRCGTNGNRGVDVDDNTKYLECYQAKAVSKSCGPNQVFDPTILNCVSMSTPTPAF